MVAGTFNYPTPYHRGDTIDAVPFLVEDFDPDTEIYTPVDLTGYIITSNYVLQGSPRQVVRYSSVGNAGISIPDATAGIFQQDKHKLNFPGVWIFDIQFETPTGDTKTYIQGFITILPDITCH
jgi:hypothetical protein